jgi:hypothetical protein
VTYTQQKLNEATLMFVQAKGGSDDYPVFIANLNAFVASARSVTLVMQKEFHSEAQFEMWYEARQKDMNSDDDFEFFNKLRVNTVHLQPFNVNSTYEIHFVGGLTIPALATAKIPLGKPDDRGNRRFSAEEPIIIDGKPVDGVQRSIRRIYSFEDRPTEDAIVLCESYLLKLMILVERCHQLLASKNRGR